MLYLIVEVDDGRAVWRAWCASRIEALTLIHNEFQPERPWACYHVVEVEREAIPS